MSVNSTRQKPWSPTYGYIGGSGSYNWKVVATHFRTEILTSVGLQQGFAGQEAGCESIINAMHAIYEDESCELVLLADA